jgi:hypothetical protein
MEYNRPLIPKKNETITETTQDKRGGVLRVTPQATQGRKNKITQRIKIMATITEKRIKKGGATMEITPKQQARELCWTMCKEGDIYPDEAKRCALVTVRLLIESFDGYEINLQQTKRQEFWMKVENEIKNLY